MYQRIRCNLEVRRAMRAPYGTRPRLERALPALRAWTLATVLLAGGAVSDIPWRWIALLAVTWVLTGAVALTLLLDPRLGSAWRILALKVLELFSARWSWRRVVGRVLRLSTRLLVRTPGRLAAALVRAAARSVGTACWIASAVRDRLEGEIMAPASSPAILAHRLAQLERDARSNIPVPVGVLTVTRRDPWRGPSEQQVQQVAQHWRSIGVWPDPQCQRRWSSTHHRGRS